jgi:hypothetical protein
MKQVSYEGPTNIKRHSRKFSHHGYLLPEISAPLSSGLISCKAKYFLWQKNSSIYYLQF